MLFTYTFIFIEKKKNLLGGNFLMGGCWEIYSCPVFASFLLWSRRHVKCANNDLFFSFILFFADPVPYLDMIGNLQSKVIRLQDVELEVKQLRDTLAEYNEEFRQVRNQGKEKFSLDVLNK